VRVALFLADAAQSAPDGKAHALGLGWTFTSSPTAPMALVVLMDVDWSETDRDIPCRIDLVDEDGGPVSVQLPGQPPRTVDITFGVRVTRPPGHPEGVPIRWTQAVQLPGLPLPPRRRFQWRVTVDGAVGMPWTASFGTRTTPAGPPRSPGGPPGEGDRPG
jgi:hypothetical protein